jgi:hypothetical protein
MSLEGSWINLEQANNHIVIPSQNITIKLSSVNVKGVVKLLNDTLLRNGSIALRPSTSADNQKWENVIWIHTDKDGKFQASLDFTGNPT